MCQSLNNFERMPLGNRRGDGGIAPPVGTLLNREKGTGVYIFYRIFYETRLSPS